MQIISTELWFIIDKDDISIITVFPRYAYTSFIEATGVAKMSKNLRVISMVTLLEIIKGNAVRFL